jgi:hypothetical protein
VAQHKGSHEGANRIASGTLKVVGGLAITLVALVWIVLGSMDDGKILQRIALVILAVILYFMAASLKEGRRMGRPTTGWKAAAGIAGIVAAALVIDLLVA